MLLQLQNDRALDIPPGNDNFVVTTDFTLPVDVVLLAIYPHAHYLGTDSRHATFRTERSRRSFTFLTGT